MICYDFAFAGKLNFPGYCNIEQFPIVSAHHKPWLDHRMDMGEERSDMVNGGGAGDRTRRLLQVQSEHTSLLQEEPHSCGLSPWCALQSTIHELLQRWSCVIMGPRSCICSLSLPDGCWLGWYFKQDCKTPQELHFAGSRTWIHLWACQGCSFNPFSRS